MSSQRERSKPTNSSLRLALPLVLLATSAVAIAIPEAVKRDSVSLPQDSVTEANVKVVGEAPGFQKSKRHFDETTTHLLVGIWEDNIIEKQKRDRIRIKRDPQEGDYLGDEPYIWTRDRHPSIEQEEDHSNDEMSNHQKRQLSAAADQQLEDGVNAQIFKARGFDWTGEFPP